MSNNDGEQQMVEYVFIEQSHLVCKILVYKGCCLGFTSIGPRHLEERLCDSMRFQNLSHKKALLHVRSNA